MKKFGLCVLAILFSGTSLQGQEAQQIEVENTISASISPTDTLKYNIDLEEDQFVWGEAKQISSNISIQVQDPDGNVITGSNEAASRDEFFKFETDTAGGFSITVTSSDSSSGEFELTLLGVEEIAENPEARADQIMKEYDRMVPGAVVGVYKDGELIFGKGYGLSNLEYDAPYTTETPTNIGSTSKQFTSFGLMLLVEEGLVDLDAPIQTYLPDVKEFEEEVVVRNLMTHTTGYREFLNLIYITGRKVGNGAPIEKREWTEIINRQPALQNEPGEEFNYNNTSFGLMTLIIEEVSGMGFHEYMNEKVFEPLGMNNSQYRPLQNSVISKRAEGYTPSEDHGFVQVNDLGGVIGAGGIYTTINDMAHWFNNYKTHELGGEDIYSQMTTSFVLNNGDETGYGFGLGLDEYKGQERIHHGGADNAHRSMLRYFPEIEAGVVVFSNYAPFNSNLKSDQIADAFFGEYFVEEEQEMTGDENTEFDVSAFSIEDFEPYEGEFELDNVPGFKLKFFVEDSVYYTQATGQQKIEITPSNTDEFTISIVNARIVFHEDEESGEFNTLTLFQNGEQKATRVTEVPWEPTQEELQKYTGVFYSEEIETEYTLTVEDSVLQVRVSIFGDESELYSGKKDQFFLFAPASGWELFFKQDENGEFGSFMVNAGGRSKDILFEKREMD